MARVCVAISGSFAVLLTSTAAFAWWHHNNNAPAPVLAAGLPALIALAGGGVASRFLRRSHKNQPAE
ncbi:MAG TPA: hypothetical protein VMB71_14070 [Acetobacteraceae bacterium]|nr:hypothetical protein [Acetobacteraceae bacterium]